MKMKEYFAETTIKFGRYSGQPLSEIVTIQPDYIEWCILNLDHFYISETTIDKLSEINTDFVIAETAREVLTEKSDKIYQKGGGNIDKPTYGKYAGSYAQDYEGLSDDFIDDVLDGFEDAYWNID